jgi:hypothetical protein
MIDEHKKKFEDTTIICFIKTQNYFGDEIDIQVLRKGKQFLLHWNIIVFTSLLRDMYVRVMVLSANFQQYFSYIVAVSFITTYAMSITTKVASSNPAQARCTQYNIM